MVLFNRGKKKDTALPDEYKEAIFGFGKKDSDCKEDHDYDNEDSDDDHDEKVKLTWIGKILKFVGWYIIKKKFSK